jgi:hypothetical protein
VTAVAGADAATALVLQVVQERRDRSRVEVGDVELSSAPGSRPFLSGLRFSAEGSGAPEDPCAAETEAAPTAFLLVEATSP